MLAAQMIAVHNAALELLRRVLLPDQPRQFIDRLSNRATQLLRLYVDQVAALDRLRGGGARQTVRVERVTVEAGGQAVVGAAPALARAAPASHGSAIGAERRVACTLAASLTGNADMDPVTVIVSALAAGATAALKPTAEQAVKDAYAGLKALITRKYGAVSVTPVEQKPESRAKRDSVAEDLRDAGASADEELVAAAQAVVDAVQRYAPRAAAAIGVDLEDVKAAALRIRKVNASGSGVRLRKGEFTGDIDIGEVDAGGGGRAPNG